MRQTWTYRLLHIDIVGEAETPGTYKVRFRFRVLVETIPKACTFLSRLTSNF